MNPNSGVNRTANSMLWGIFCTSSWTWCIGMFLPFLLLRLWGWPGFWAFFVPNVLGCALFGFMLTPERSRAVVTRLGPVLVLFSAVTIAYQCYFAGWAAHIFFVPTGALATVASTGAPVAILLVGAWLALRGERALVAAGALAFAVAIGAFAISAMLGDAPAAEALAASALAGGDSIGGALASSSARAPLVPLDRLAWAIPTIVAGFLLCPYLDLTFHRALQRAPRPRVAFATFGATFALMLIGVAGMYDAATGAPRIGVAIGVVWGVQLAFTVAVHLREIASAPADSRLPAWASAGLGAAAVLLATPAFAFTLGPKLPAFDAPLWGGTEHALLPGEPMYLVFLGAYGLLFPALLWFGGWQRARVALFAVLSVGVPCYLMGAWDFATYLMPIPILVALTFRSPVRRTAAKSAKPAL